MDKIEDPIKVLTTVLIPPTNAQVTKILVDGQVVYIRENFVNGENILELCAPEESWAKIAAVVVLEDSVKRGVWRNDEFTLAWAEEIMNRIPDPKEDTPAPTGPDGRF